MTNGEDTSLLEQKRFVISRESIGGMKSVRTKLEELKGKHPELSGLGFFGSRITGAESPGSDYDVCIFYDSSKIYAPFGNKLEWQQLKRELEKGVSTRFDQKIFGEAGGGLTIDISRESTDKDLELLKRYVDPSLSDRQFNNKDFDDLMAPYFSGLVARFFLVVGEEVYANRKYILDQLQSWPQGEKYFQILMKCLAWAERGDIRKRSLPGFKGYPKTLDEASKYFLKPID